MKIDMLHFGVKIFDAAVSRLDLILAGVRGGIHSEEYLWLLVGSLCDHPPSLQQEEGIPWSLYSHPETCLSSLA